mgnify:CR=1 FL=1|tara:strand:- start:4007 stop:4630 length:624 start_codon:yes stop_codon:yes gene_type:complete
MIKAIIFDFDDTLVSYKDIYLHSHKEAAKKLNIKVPSDIELLKYAGLPWKTMVSKIWPDIKFEDFYSAYVEVDDIIDRTPVKGAKEVILQLSKKYDLFIISSREKDSILELMEKSSLPIENFKAIYGDDSLPYHKPDPRIFDPILKEYKPEECIFIGDSDYDLIPAQKAKITFIAYLSGVCPKDVFEEMNADFIIDDLRDIPKLLKN